MKELKSSYFKNNALALLEGNWPQAAIITIPVLLFQIPLAFSTESDILSPQRLLSLLSSLVSIWLMFRFQDLYRNISIWNRVAISVDFKRFITYIGAYIVYTVFITLWTLLLIIPGIVMSCAYSQLWYIMRENPDMYIMDALSRSVNMMRGHKMQFFILQLSFIGWIILSVLTAGLGFLLLIPYMFTANAAFYEELKKEYEKNSEHAKID